MGRQVNFYMLAEDLAEFEAYLRQKGDVCFVEARLPVPEVRCASTLAISKMGETGLTSYLVRSVDLAAIRLQEVKAQNYWRVNVQVSPVIELSRSYYNQQYIRRGRLFFETGFYDSSHCWQGKSPDFIKWADSLLQWIRRRYIKGPATGFYIGSHTEKWVAEGGVLNPL